MSKYVALSSTPTMLLLMEIAGTVQLECSLDVVDRTKCSWNKMQLAEP